MGSLAVAVDELVAADLDDLTAPVAMAEVTDLRRQINRLEAVYLARLVRVDRSGVALAEHGSTQAWVRAACRVPATRASRDVHLARDLVDVLPATTAALADGGVTVEHVQLIASLRASIGDEALRAAEPHLADWARRVTPTELRGVIRHVQHSYAPDTVRADERDDYDRRELSTATILDGVGVGRWTLHPIGHETVMTALHAASRPVAGDTRTPAQRRADALVTIAEIALRSGTLPITGGVKPHVTVLVTTGTLTDAPASPAADYPFGATSSGELARRIACDAEIARVVLGPRGEVLDAGRAMRTFSAAQTRAVVARDRHCIWPGCDTPPGWCETHHLVHWAQGGPTSVDNAALLCGRHHDRVHHHNHAIHIDPDGRRRVDVRAGTAARPTAFGRPTAPAVRRQ